jgi:hypothetical protein
MANVVSPAGWFPDPWGRHEYRYWDGTEWTDHVADGGRAATDVPRDSAVGAEAPASAATVSSPAALQGQVMPFQAVEYADIAVRLDASQARDAAAGLLGARGFRVSFLDSWNGIAERGNKGMNVAFGALSQYYCVGLTVFTAPGGETVVRLLRAPTGYWTGGGLIGKARVSGTFAKIVNELVGEFTRQGILVGVQHA